MFKGVEIMINVTDKYFMMIEPDKIGKPSNCPIEDELTEKVEFIFSNCKPTTSYRGWHTTNCGKMSDNKDWQLPNGMITNSLCCYYIKYYRPFIPETEIMKIESIFYELNLKRCPFCGGDAIFKEEKDISIVCFSCGVSTVSLELNENTDDITAIKSTLFKLWNRRIK